MQFIYADHVQQVLAQALEQPAATPRGSGKKNAGASPTSKAQPPAAKSKAAAPKAKASAKDKAAASTAGGVVMPSEAELSNE